MLLYPLRAGVAHARCWNVRPCFRLRHHGPRLVRAASYCARVALGNITLPHATANISCARILVRILVPLLSFLNGLWFAVLYLSPPYAGLAKTNSAALS